MKVPTLVTIMALKPADADALGLRAAIAKATELQSELKNRLAEIAMRQKGPALAITDKEVEEGRREAEALDLASRRIAELLEGMRAELRTLDARDLHAALRVEAREVCAALETLAAWQSTDFDELRAIMGRGFRAQDEAVSRHAAFNERLREAYRDPDVRACGPLGVSVPPLPGLSSMPRSFFPNWGTP